MKTLLIAIIAGGLLTGCYTPPKSFSMNPQELAAFEASLDAGKQPSMEEAKDVAMGYFHVALHDPDSVKIRYLNVYKDTINPTGCGGLPCYTIAVEANAKSVAGGYTGYRSYYFDYRNGKVYDVTK